MAVEVQNQRRPHKKDKYSTKCSSCGHVVTYTGADVRKHRRWPYGFIWCPVCKKPIGHREDSLIECYLDTVEKRERTAKEKVYLKVQTILCIIFLIFGLLLIVVPSIVLPFTLLDNGVTEYVKTTLVTGWLILTQLGINLLIARGILRSVANNIMDVTY